MAISFKHLYKNNTLIGSGTYKFRRYSVSEPKKGYTVTIHIEDPENRLYGELSIDGNRVGSGHSTPFTVSTSGTIEFGRSSHGPSPHGILLTASDGSVIGFVLGNSSTTYTTSNDTIIYCACRDQIVTEAEVYDKEGNVIELEPPTKEQIKVVQYGGSGLTPDQNLELEEALMVMEDAGSIDILIPEFSDYVVYSLYYIVADLDVVDCIANGGTIDMIIKLVEPLSQDVVLGLACYKNGEWSQMWNDGESHAEVLANGDIHITTSTDGVIALLIK